MVPVVVDTNMFLSIFELKLDILSLIDQECGVGKYCTISLVVDELRKMRDKHAVMALHVLQNVPIYDVSLDESKGVKTVDDALLHFCEENKAILATQDKELINRAKSKHLKTMQIRQKKYIIIR
ncbi:MAG: PIN domain-containing protein [Candidatus Woesearchaeota archaeon]